MISAVREYWDELRTSFGAGWNRFWFAPSDPFTLCALRVLVGLVAFYYAATFTPDLDRLLGPASLVPPSTAQTIADHREKVRNRVAMLPDARAFRFSYFDYANSHTALWAMHIASLTVIGLMIVGLFSRLTTPLSFLAVLSYMQRVPLMTTQIEPVLAMVMLYLSLAPSGACLSLDARRKAANAPAWQSIPRSSWATVVQRMIQLHLTIVLVMMALAKSAGDVWWDGSAMWWLAAHTEARLVNLTWLHESPRLVQAWTHVTLWFELAAPILLWGRLTRPLALLVGAFVWGLLSLATGLLAFYTLLWICCLAFIPGERLRKLMPGD